MIVAERILQWEIFICPFSSTIMMLVIIVLMIAIIKFCHPKLRNTITKCVIISMITGKRLGELLMLSIKSASDDYIEPLNVSKDQLTQL